MAIALRGTPTTSSAINGGNITLTLPSGLQQNDVVIVQYAHSTNPGTITSTGWTQIGATLGGNTRLMVFRKVMGASPDTTIAFTGTGVNTDSSTAIAAAFSGVDTALPEGGVALTSSNTTGTNPDPAAITPIWGNSAVLACACTSLVDTTGTAAPTNYTDFTQVSSSDTASTTSYFAWRNNRPGGTSEDPAAFTGVSSAAYVVYTIALKSADVPGVSNNATDDVRPQAMRKALQTLPIALMAAVAWTPLPPPVVIGASSANIGFHNERHQYSPAGRSQALLGQVSAWPNQQPAAPPPPPTGWDQTPNSDARPPAMRLPRRSVELLGRTAWDPSPFYDLVEPIDFTPSSDQRPPAHRTPPRSVDLLSQIVLAKEPFVEFAEGWRCKWQEPPPLAKRSVDLLGGVSWAAQAPFIFFEGWRSLYSLPVRLDAAPRLEGQISWPGIQYQFVAPTPSEWWFERWPYPPQRPQPRLEGQISWPGIGYSIAPTLTPTEWWFERWPNPMWAAPRSIELKGDIAWGAKEPFVEFQEGWRSSFGEPPRAKARSVEMLGQAVWAANVPFVFFEAWRQELSRPVNLTPLPRLEGQISWPGIAYQFQAPTPSDWWFERWPPPPKAPLRSVKLYGDDVVWPGFGYNFIIQVPTPTEFWFERWPPPPKAAARAVDLLGPSVIWPGVGYQFVVVTTPTEWWHERWPVPPKAALRSISLLGPSAVWPGIGFGITPTDWWFDRWPSPPRIAARSPELLGPSAIWAANQPFVFIEGGWRSTYPLPLQRWQVPRLQGAISGPGIGYQFVVVVPPSGWMAPFQQPLQRWAIVRLQGALAFAGEGFAFAIPPQGWQAPYLQPLQRWQIKVQQGAIVGLGLDYAFVPALTPSAWQLMRWTDPPKRAARSVYLLETSWASWPPQFILQLAPPEEGVPVSFTYGVKRGAATATAAKQGATLGTRVRRRPSLSTRVKPPPH